MTTIILTPEKRQAFLDALVEMPNVSIACKAVGVKRQSMYEIYEREPDFAKLWDAALKKGVDSLEGEALRRGFNGVDKPLTHQGEITYARDYNGERDLVTGAYPFKLDQNGDRIPMTVKEYSDTLAIFLLKAHAPEKFRDRVDVTHSDSDDARKRLIEARERTGK